MSEELSLHTTRWLSMYWPQEVSPMKMCLKNAQNCQIKIVHRLAVAGSYPSITLLASTSLRCNFNLFGTLSNGSCCLWPAREDPEKKPVRWRRN